MGVCDDAYARAAEDAEFLERVATAYTGGWDVLDALWWESHPDEVSPAGTPSSSERLRELQHLVFSRGGGSAEDWEAYRVLETVIATERQAVRAAIAAAEAPLHPVHDPMPVTERSDSELAPTGRSTHRRWLLPSAIAAAAVLAAGVGFYGGALREPAEGTGPAALDVFDRPQAERDKPAIPMPEEFDPDAFRILMHLTIDGDRSYLAYAAKNSFGICAVVTTDTDGVLSTSCAPADEFAVDGLDVHWSTDGDSSFDHMISWDPNGDVSSRDISAS